MGGGAAVLGQKLFHQNQTLLTQKWNTLPWNLHWDSKQLMGTDEALQNQASSGFQTLVFVSLVSFIGTDLGLFNLLFNSFFHFFLLSSLFLSPNSLFSLLSLPWFGTLLLFFLCQCMGLSPPFPSMLLHLLFFAYFPLLSPYSHPLHSPVSLPTSTSSFLHVLSLSFILFLCHLPIPSLSVLSSSFFPWCHFNYWLILCSLSSLSLFFSPLLSLRDSSLSLPICFRNAIAVEF